VQLHKNVVAAAAVAFLGLFAAVFFLLGRESRRPRAPAVAAVSQDVAASPTPTAVAAVAPMPTMAVAAAAPMPATAPVTPAAMPSAPALPAPPPSAPVIAMAPLPPLERTAAPGAGPEAAARDYFLRMQAIQTVGPSSDTGEFANKLLTSAMSGDSSGFDDLIKVAEAGADRARSISPPSCCVEYHERMIGMLTESVQIVRQLKAAIASNDSGALTRLAASGNSLQTRATALEDEARQIKTRLGLAH